MGTSERQYIRSGFGNRSQHGVRSEMVAKQLLPAQWETLADSTVGPDNRIRCVQKGLGSQLPRSKYWRPLVSSGKDPPHQLSRTTSCLSSSEVICLQPESNLDPSSSGQHYSNRLPEQNGRYPFTFTLKTGCGDLELVHRKELDYPCRAPSRNRECTSRLGATTCTGQIPATGSSIEMCSCSWKTSWAPFQSTCLLPGRMPNSRFTAAGNPTQQL